MAGNPLRSSTFLVMDDVSSIPKDVVSNNSTNYGDGGDLISLIKSVGEEGIKSKNILPILALVS